MLKFITYGFVVFSLLFFSSILAAEEVLIEEKQVIEERWEPNKARDVIQNNVFLKGLVDQGVELISLGHENGFDSWLLTAHGDVQTLYTRPGSDVVFSGILIGPDGQNITAGQMARYETLNSGALTQKLEEGLKEKERVAPLSKAERLFDEVTKLSGVSFVTNPTNPHLYVFVKLGCDGCISYSEALKTNYIDEELINVTFFIVPETEDHNNVITSFMSQSSRKDLFFDFIKNPKIEGGATAKSDEVVQDLKRVKSLLEEHNLQTTLPLSFYKSGVGEIKLIQDVPNSLEEMIFDLAVSQ